MNQSLDLKNDPNIKVLLNFTVEATRKLLKCDRVIVYDARELPKALVLAESVDAQHSSILGKTIKDPFLEGKYLEMYFCNTSLIIEDIYAADVSESDLEDLEKLGIKSLVIAPIALENQLLALLVAHQASKLQPWHSKAIHFLTKRANAVAFALSTIAKSEKSSVSHLKKQRDPESSPEAEQPVPRQGSLNGELELARQPPQPPLRVNMDIKRQSLFLGQGSDSHRRSDKQRPDISWFFVAPSESASTSSEDSNFPEQTAESQQNTNSQTTELKENNKGNRNIQPREQKTEIQKDRSKLIVDVTNKIANEQEQQDILNTTVEEVRHLLLCDRVVVYSLDESNYGVIVAESVAAGWTKALGRTIDDPCFTAGYFSKYRNGGVRAWDNIYGEDTNPCYLEQLENLEVKAKIVAPIIYKGQLLGLLIAHQCSNTRSWQEPEINWITEIASQIGLMLKYTKISAKTAQEEEKQLAESDNKWNQHFTDAIHYIRQSITKEDILKASVREVRRVLNCDRVVVYSMNQDNYGMIVAESVAAGWTRAEGKVIKDPCFQTKYLDKYRNGRVRAWSNIYESGFTSCYIEQLEQLEVKANLVTPIVNEGKLFGLLVAHQCSNTRQWQQPEIRWVTDIATQVGFALDNAQVLADAKRLRQQREDESKWTDYFTDVIHHIRHSLKTEDILQTSVREVRRILNCDRVVLYSLNQNLRYGTVIEESVSPGWTRALGKKIDDPCFEPTYREKYLDGRARAWNNIRESSMSQCYIEQLEKLEVKANLVTPVINEGKLFGLLVAHQCSNTRQWQQPEIRWMTEIATQVGFALDNAQVLADAKRLRQQVEDESKWTDYFTDAIQHIRQSLKTGDILKTSVQEVRRILNCDRVVVYSMNQENYGMIVAESVAAGWTRAKGMVINDPCFEARYLAQYRNGRVRAWSNIYESGLTRCYIEQLEQLEVKANLVTPIINEGKLFGLLVAHQCSDTRDWQQPEIRWVAQIATQVGFALDNAKLLEQVDRSTNTSNQLYHQQYEQTATLKHQVVKILAENGDAYQTLSQEARRQSETTIKVLHEIQELSDSLSAIALNVQQVKFQEQQNNLAIQSSQESLERIIKSISNIQFIVQNVATGFDNLSNSCQKLSDTVNTIKDLSKQIVKQSMSITRAINRSQIQEDNQNSLIDLSDTIFSLMQQLFEATATIEPLFANIKIEVRDKTIALDNGTQQLINEVGEFQTFRQKLDRVVSFNNQMGNFIENISQSVENQRQSSTVTQDSVQEVASIAEEISQQSMAITQSFKQLVVLVQKL